MKKTDLQELKKMLCYKKENVFDVRTKKDEKALENSTDITCLCLKELIVGEYKDVQMQIFGPMEAPIYKIREKMRMKIIMKCKSNKRTREMLSKLLIHAGKNSSSNVSVSLDMNPSSV